MLVFAHHEDSQFHADARRWWEDLINGSELIGLPWLVVTGFVRVSTNIKMLDQPTTPELAVEAVNDWFRYPQVFPLNPGSNHMTFLADALAAIGTGGNRVPDAHIAALAVEYEAEVHTHDRGFARFPGLRWRNPIAETA